MKRYYVYILASLSRRIYVGVTSNIKRRVYEHKAGRNEGFTKRYRIHRLVYYERYDWIHDAIAREKQFKRWNRQKKVNLIVMDNPMWNDLSAGWYEDRPDWMASWNDTRG